MSAASEAHSKHTKEDTAFATALLDAGESRDEVVNKLTLDKFLSVQGAITCVEQILWARAAGDKAKQNEISDWSHALKLKYLREKPQLKSNAVTGLLALSEGFKGGKRKGVSRTQKRKGRKGKSRKNKGRK